MKQEDFDTVTQLGTVAIKTIIVFLALIIAVGVGVYWYSSELEKATPNTPAGTTNTQSQTNNTERSDDAEGESSDAEDTSDEQALMDEWRGTILEVNQEENSLVFAVEGEQVTVSFGEDTLITENREEPVTSEALTVEDTIRVMGSMNVDTGVVQAQEIILETGQAESSAGGQETQDEVSDNSATNEDPATSTEEQPSAEGELETLPNEEREAVE